MCGGFHYPGWVVGASHVRAVDDGWPQQGSRLHHVVGTWPLLLEDSAVVGVCDPGRTLDLPARGRPFGEARARFDLGPVSDSGAWITVTENAVIPLVRALLARRAAPVAAGPEPGESGACRDARTTPFLAATQGISS